MAKPAAALGAEPSGSASFCRLLFWYFILDYGIVVVYSEGRSKVDSAMPPLMSPTPDSYSDRNPLSQHREVRRAQDCVRHGLAGAQAPAERLGVGLAGTALRIRWNGLAFADEKEFQTTRFP
jgi:hypothetical protein